MWLNVIEAKLNTRQCWQAVLHMVGSSRGGGGGGIRPGALRFTVRFLRSNHSARFVTARQILMFAAPCPPSLCSGKSVSIFVPLFFVVAAHTIVMDTLRTPPMLLVTPPTFQAPSPSSAIVDEFII